MPESKMRTCHSTRNAVAIFFLRLYLVIFLASYCGASIIEDTCDRATSGRPDIGYTFCVDALRSEHGGASSPVDLALTAVRLANASAAAVRSRIAELAAEEANAPWRGQLSVCCEVYDVAVGLLEEAAGFILAARDVDAVMLLGAAEDAAEDCEDSFREMDQASPLEDEDRHYRRLAALALAIVVSL